MIVYKVTNGFSSVFMNEIDINKSNDQYFYSYYEQQLYAGKGSLSDFYSHSEVGYTSKRLAEKMVAELKKMRGEK